MDEENKQNSGVSEKIGEAVKQGTKKQAKKALKHVFKTIIMPILPYLLLTISIIIIGILAIATFDNFINHWSEMKSKTSNSDSITYTQKTDENTKPDRIVVDPKKRAGEMPACHECGGGGAYSLDYKNTKTVNEIKEEIKKLNPEIDFENANPLTDSDIKTIGILMENGLQVQGYNSEELKTLVVFVKAGIASTSLDLRAKEYQHKEVKPQEIIDNDYVYGTVNVHRIVTTSEGGKIITNNDEKDVKLEYLDEEKFMKKVNENNEEALKYFSINDDGDLLLAKAKITTVSTKYSDNTPEEYKNQGANGTTAKIELCDPIDYKKYITEYVTSYGLLADLLTITDDTPVTLNMAHYAFNHQIVLTAEEQLIITETTDDVNYTQSELLFDYVDYNVYGPGWQGAIFGIQEGEDPLENSNIQSIGYPGGECTTWEYRGKTYRINKEKVPDVTPVRYTWTVDEQVVDYSEYKESQSNCLIANGKEGEIDYTSKNTNNFTITTTTKTEDRSFKLKISKVDNWYMYFEKEYLSTPKADSGNGNETTTPISYTAEYPEDFTDNGNLNLNDQVIKDFISQKESQYPGGECEVSNAVQKQKTKTDYEGTSKTIKDKYTPESEIKYDRIKNVQMENGKPTYADTDKDSFLYAYHHYRNEEQDLFLEQDAEERLFKLLDSNIEDGTNPTEGVSDVIKYLLYAYDGVDRGGANPTTMGDRINNLVIVDETTDFGSSSYTRPIGHRWRFIKLYSAHRAQVDL